MSICIEDLNLNSQRNSSETFKLTKKHKKIYNKNSKRRNEIEFDSIHIFISDKYKR